MLSRHAEGVFWLGRYVERAGDISRMLDVAYHAELERPSGPAGAAWRDLLRVLYLERRFAKPYGDEVTRGNINRFLVFDLDNPSSVARSAREARTNVMSVRDVVPSELLEAVNMLYAHLASHSLERHIESPHEIYESVSGLCRRISGAIDESMSRNDEYRFLTVGRLLERAEMICRMIDVNRSHDDTATWMSVLRSVSGFHAFIRGHGPLAPASDVVAFLLLEPSFPFSVLHCLKNAGAQAAEVSGSGTWKSPPALAGSPLNSNIPTIHP